uniref:Putative snare protein pep12/vam3/syntaxin 7/syntaxin 17 n=1 Tax=Panstrongylus lignarius TaxID=156445 RepID=A0A224XHV8_9HEMI
MDSNLRGYSSYQNDSEKRDFNRTAQSVGSNIQKISQNVLSMNKMVNLLGTSQDNPELRQKLYQIKHYTNLLAKDTSSMLLQLSQVQIPQSPPEHREYKMQRERLAEDLTAALNAFQQIQRTAYQKEKEEVQKSRVARGLPPPQTKHRENQLIELTPSSQTQLQIEQEERELQIIEEQEASIRQLENDIQEVSEIFKDLGKLIHSQGEIVDSIEANIEGTKVYVSTGATHLREANRYSSTLRKYKCLICVVIPAVILTCTILILTWKQSD